MKVSLSAIDQNGHQGNDDVSFDLVCRSASAVTIMRAALAMRGLLEFVRRVVLVQGRAQQARGQRRAVSSQRKRRNLVG